MFSVHHFSTVFPGETGLSGSSFLRVCVGTTPSASSGRHQRLSSRPHRKVHATRKTVAGVDLCSLCRPRALKR